MLNPVLFLMQFYGLFFCFLFWTFFKGNDIIPVFVLPWKNIRNYCPAGRFLTEKTKRKRGLFMRKAFSLFMACAMTAASLAGCSAAASKEASTEAVTAVETTAGTTAATPDNTTETIAEQTPAAQAGLEEPGDSMPLRVGSMKGPTSMGLVSLMDDASKDLSEGDYEFTMVTDASELVAKMVAGDLDIALVPANMASILYQKTKQNINVIDINTLGVLYVVAADESIDSVDDLKGKTLYMTGKGTSPDYVLQYLLTSNGMTADDLTIEYKSEATEVAAVLQQTPDAIGLLPQPFVTVAMSQNENLKMVLDLTAEWDKVQSGGSGLVTGVTVCRSDLLTDETSKAAVDLFMAEHKESAEFANTNVAEAAELVAASGIIAKAPVAVKAMPYCSISYIDGQEMKEKLSGYLNVLFEQDPTSVGGKLPEDGFYYIP